jgi:2-iminobutanoate/2-iminopropanoate deaminase
LHDPSIAPRDISGPRYSERPANAALSRSIVQVSLNVAADPPFPWAEGLAYSQAIRVDNLVFTAGQGGFDESGEIVGGGVEAQIRQAFQNLAAALASQGASLASVAKLTVYLVDGEDYEIFKRVREDMFTAPYPASTAVVAGGLLIEGMAVEMDAVAAVGAQRTRA